jgi:C4-dicarboxylate-specific signal transduction histidine kinase
VDRDWLKLGAQQTRGSSWYGLRPENTLGFIGLTARNNSQLEETTDREGFKHNAYYDNFYEVLSFFVKFTEDIQEFLRRGWNEFRREVLTLEAAAAYNVPPEELGGTLSSAFMKAGEHRALLQVAGARLSATANKVSTAMNDFLAHPGAEGSAQNLRSEIGSLRADIDSAVSTVTKTEVFLEELVRLEKVNKAIQEQLEALREQIRQVHEIVGLGLTAEALTHEMNHVASDLAARAQDLSKHIRARGISDRKLIAFVDHVKTTVNALQKQLQFLAPSLQFVREKRELIVLKDFLGDIFRHYIQRFSGEPVSLLLGTVDPTFKVEMNRGKLIQVLDNLFLNSEYWLLQEVKAHRIVAGQIKVEARRPILTVSDNGSGIDPLLESSIFEPFVSGKGKGKGRGLGLYIVRQLLEAEDCHIDLSPERNKNGRLFKFEIDLAGVASD